MAAAADASVNRYLEFWWWLSNFRNVKNYLNDYDDCGSAGASDDYSFDPMRMQAFDRGQWMVGVVVLGVVDRRYLNDVRSTVEIYHDVDVWPSICVASSVFVAVF